MKKPIDFFKPQIGQPIRATLILRAVVGAVFIASGAIKFLFPNQGPGRFLKIGLPEPALLAHFVGTVEILGGCLLVAGLLTRLATVPLIIDMLVAIATTKIPLLFGPGPEPVAALPKMGLWAFLYQSRLDVTMLLGCAYLLIVGAGLWSLDAYLSLRMQRGRLLESVLGRSGHLPNAPVT